VKLSNGNRVTVTVGQACQRRRVDHLMTATNANDEVLAFAIVAMAFALGMTTLTGGIESPERLATLRYLGCASARGYLLARALAAPDVRRLLLPAPRW